MKKNDLITYGVLLIILLLCAGGLIFLGSDLMYHDSASMGDLKLMSKKELFEWINENDLSEYVNYEYKYSDTIDNGYVIDQSLDPDKLIKEKFDVFISKGNIVDLTTEEFKTKEEFEEFISNFKNVDVTYKEEPDPTKEDGEIIKYSKDEVDLKDDNIEVTVADNSKDEPSKEEEKEKEKEEEKVLDNTEDKKKEDDTSTDINNDKDVVLIPGNLLGMEESKFIKLLNDLGFENLKKNPNKFYSFSSKKDTIYSYDDGKIDTSKTINYAISLGDYVSAFKAAEYNGKTLTDANSLVKKYNTQNAHITLKTVDKVTSDSGSVGKLEGCTCAKSGTNSIITCNLLTAKSTTNEKTIPNLAGKTEDEFKNSLKELGFNSFNKGVSKFSSQPYNTVVSHDQGLKKTTDTINYALSLGPYSFNANDYNGKTLDAAKQVASSYNSQGANIQFAEPQKTENESIPNNTLYDCSASTGTGSTIITCKLAYSIPYYLFLSKSTLIQNYSASTFDQTISNLKNLYDGKFTIQYLRTSNSEEYSGKIVSESPGTIIDITVNGNNQYTQGSYRADTPIRIFVVDKTTQ